MSLSVLYRQFIELAKIENGQTKERAMKAFFEKLNIVQLPEFFNWAEEVLEGIHVKERGSQIALLWVNLNSGEEERYSFKDFAAQGNRLANYLREHGVEKGDSFYMTISLIPQIWFSTYATVKGGFIGVPTPTTMTARDFEYRFKVYAPKAVVAEEVFTKSIDEALEKVAVNPKVKIVIGSREGWENYDDVKKEDSSTKAEKTKCDDLILSFFTSGTTGLPKRVGHTAISYPLGHLSTSYVIGIGPNDIHNNLSAPGWAKYAWSSFFAPLNVGATTTGFYYSGRLDGNKYLEAVANYKLTTFCAPPTAWRLFINSDLNKYKFESLREVVSAGEPLNPEIFEKWKKYTGTEIRDFYGQTESTAMIGNPPWYKGEMIIPGSFGCPTPMYDISLADDAGNEIVNPRETGNIIVKLDRWHPIGIFKEYISNPEKTKDVFVKNFYYTGDKAYFDEKGYWWFVGRADDVIKSSDYRIGPFEVESALCEHPAVAEAAVVGSSDLVKYQLVKGFVVLKPGYAPSREIALEIFKSCRKILARYKIPRIIEFVPDLPKTLSGKIIRAELRRNEEESKKRGEKGVHVYFYNDFTELKSS